MDKKDLECYAYGIHIGNLTGEDAESILKKYYHVEYFPEISFLTKESCFKKSDLIKSICDWTLYVLLLNGYRLPLRGDSLESIDSSLYFKDMLMLLYLYVINQNEALSANDIRTTSSTNTKLFYIEQSGFGNILGMRRENKFERKGEGKFDSRKVKYVATFSGTCADYNAIEDSICSVKRDEKKDEYHFPYACKNVVEALLKSRKHNFFVFFAEKDETLTEDEIIRMNNYDTSGEFLGGIPIQVFVDEIQGILKYLAITGGGTLKKLRQYLNLSAKDIDEDKEYKFYEKYFKELGESEKEGKEYGVEERKSCIQRADHYLSELLFAYLYYARTVKRIKEMTDEQKINDAAFPMLLDVIYEVSKSPACFSRDGHIEHYEKKFLSVSASEKKPTERELYNLKKSIVRNEKYSVQKFLPAFFYCFLFYLHKAGVIKEGHKKKSLIGVEDCVMGYIESFEMLDKVSFQSWMKTSEAKELWIKRKIDYFKPLDYEIGKALF